MNITTNQHQHLGTQVVDGDLVARALRRRSFATIATVSASGVPHAAGVLYGLDGTSMYVSTLRSSRKARNISDVGRAAVCVPVRRLPIGPPSSIQFQASAEVVATDDERLLDAVERGALRAVTRHGELDLAGGCFLRIALPNRMPTYGLGMSLRALVADPLAAGRVAEIDWA